MAEKTLKLNPKYDDYDFPTIPPDPLPGHPGNLTPEQENAVDDLRAALEKEGCTERLDTLTMVNNPRMPPSALSSVNPDPAPLSARPQVQRRSLQADVSSSLSAPPLCVQRPDIIPAGSSTARSGGKSSAAASTTSSAPSSTPSAPRSSSTTRNSTTRPTRFALSAPSLHPLNCL